MSEARFDPSLLAALRPSEAIVDAAKSPASAEAARFEEGQISGPFGPKFVGYGEEPSPGHASFLVNAVAIAVLAGIIIAVWR
jgi:hypothetical protein